MGELNLSNSKGRDAVVNAISVRSPLKVRWLDQEQRQVSMVRLLKASLDHDMEALVKRFGSPAEVGKALLDADPEVDLETFGSALRDTSRVYVDPAGEMVHAVQFWEIVRRPDGTERERRPRRIDPPNTTGDSPLRWSGKLMKKSQVFNKFVFVNKLQVVHVNGLTYDFLYGMAKELEAADSLLLLGAGPKSNLPLIFRRGSTPYRGFLEGRTQGDKYCLLLHLSNMEFKVPEEPKA